MVVICEMTRIERSEDEIKAMALKEKKSCPEPSGAMLAKHKQNQR